MRGVLLRVRCSLRRRWPATVAVALMVAVVAGAVLTLAAGARRTREAPDAYTAYVGGDLAGTVQQSSGAPRTAEVAALPGIRSVQAMTFVFVVIVHEGVDPNGTIAFTGDRPAASRLVAGRAARPDDSHEFVADESFVARYHARLGDRFHVISWTHAEADHGLGYNGKPLGPAFEGRLVGIVDSPGFLEDSYNTLVFSRALLRQDVGVVATIMGLRAEPGLTTRKLRAELDTLPGGAALDLQPGAVVSSNIRNAVSAQAVGTGLMAAVLGIAALVALGQLLMRHARLTEAERRPLAAIGFTRTQLVGESVARAAVPTVAGLTLGVGLAIVASGIFPAGFVRPLEPHPGLRLDATVLLLGGAVLAVALLAWVALTLAIADRVRDRRARPLTHDAIARRVPSASAAIGARFALTGRDGTSSAALGTLAALALIMAGIVGTIAFATSLDRLVTDQGRFGSNYSVGVGDNSDATAPFLRAKLSGAPNVEGFTILTSASVRAGRATVGLVGLERVEGTVAPHVLTGRLPEGPDEIALGRNAAHDLHVGMGDRLALAAGARRVAYRVVGTVVVPTIGGNDGVGQGGVTTAAGLRRLTRQPDVTMAAVQFRKHAPPDAVRQLTKRVGLTAGVEDPPGVIVNVARVRRVPAILAALLSALVLLALFHALLVSIQGRRHDIAILRALGADGRWVGRTVHWQASALTVTPLVVGVPLGLVAGSLAFRAFAGHIGAVPDPALPLLLVVAIVAGLVVVANLVALVPSRRARRTATATMLKTE